MKLLIPKWTRAFLLGIAVGGAVVLGFSQFGSTHARGWEEWTMPARFEGQGAVTLGCAFWDVPEVHAYSDDNPRLDYVEIGVGGESNDVKAIASIDGPEGTAFISGTRCAVSVDWSAFPNRRRPND